LRRRFGINRPLAQIEAENEALFSVERSHLERAEQRIDYDNRVTASQSGND